jgi:hypothetical protein
MQAHFENAVQKAIANLPQRNIAKKGAAEFELRKLYPISSWKPQAGVSRPDSVVVGEDSCGNLFLMASDGSVSFWDHETDGETILAAGVEPFLNSLSAPTPVVLKPGQVKSVWVNPKFLEEQRRKGNVSK